MRKQIGKFTIDTSITFGTRVSQLALSIGTSIIVARVLGPQGKGNYSLAVLLPFLLIGFGNLGIGQASVFHTCKKAYSPFDKSPSGKVWQFQSIPNSLIK